MMAVALRSPLPHAERMAIPLIKFEPNRRWMQVSLQAMFVAVASLCVSLSLWAVPAEAILLFCSDARSYSRAVPARVGAGLL
jgi:hypothetical protein